MKIAYIHCDNPNKEKVLDTNHLYNREYLPFHKNFFPGTFPQTEEEWTKGELERLEEKYKKGIILSYRIIDDQNDVNEKNNEKENNNA